ncbi:MAG: hypothetical protein M0Z96_01175 [Actinomycetota bacterium]|nr:hypothetical protein [Actinomycetota bacterium]
MISLILTSSSLNVPDKINFVWQKLALLIVSFFPAAWSLPNMKTAYRLIGNCTYLVRHAENWRSASHGEGAVLVRPGERQGRAG